MLAACHRAIASSNSQAKELARAIGTTQQTEVTQLQKILDRL
ncbi:hypothetical protein [Nonomuraea sp. CA-141351]